MLAGQQEHQNRKIFFNRHYLTCKHYTIHLFTITQAALCGGTRFAGSVMPASVLEAHGSPACPDRLGSRR